MKTQITDHPPFQSIYNKFNDGATRILFSLIGILFIITVVGGIGLVVYFLKSTENRIKNEIINKGNLLVNSNSIALRSLAADNAFSAMRELLGSSVKKDEDIFYGIYMDNESRLIASAIKENKEELFVSQKPKMDSLAKWAQKINTPEYMQIQTDSTEHIEFAAPVEVDGVRLGTIRYGISTQTMNTYIYNAKIQATALFILIFVVELAVCLILYRKSVKSTKEKAKSITNPLYRLVEATKNISAGEYTKPIDILTNDELGELSRNFEEMRKKIFTYTNKLENLVDERTFELRSAQQQLIEKAHQAGMADIASSTLHNVGNILNSVNASSQAIEEVLHLSSLNKFNEANKILRQNINNLETFFSKDSKGKKLMDYYLKLDDLLVGEKVEIAEQIKRLRQKVEAITEVVHAQQTYAGSAQLTEKYSLEGIIDDALTIRAESLKNLKILVVKNFQRVPKVPIQKIKLMHILINLISNAEESLGRVDPGSRNLTITLEQIEKKIYLKVADSGLGIPDKDKEKIFEHGFTTKQKGHGFGLHSCANFMTEMNGQIRVEDNVTQGAKFVLEFNIT